MRFGMFGVVPESTAGTRPMVATAFVSIKPSSILVSCLDFSTHDTCGLVRGVLDSAITRLYSSTSRNAAVAADRLMSSRCESWYHPTPSGVSAAEVDRPRPLNADPLGGVDASKEECNGRPHP